MRTKNPDGKLWSNVINILPWWKLGDSMLAGSDFAIFAVSPYDINSNFHLIELEYRIYSCTIIEIQSY